MSDEEKETTKEENTETPLKEGSVVEFDLPNLNGKTGLFMMCVKGSQFQTSYEIHTEAGGDPEVFLEWERQQKKKEGAWPKD